MRGLYKGLASPIVGVGLINALLFGVYGHLLRWQQPVCRLLTSLAVDFILLTPTIVFWRAYVALQAATLDDPNYVSPLSHIFLAGVGSGFVNSFVSCPFELAKINMQNQGVPSAYRVSDRHCADLDVPSCRNHIVAGGRPSQASSKERSTAVRSISCGRAFEQKASPAVTAA